MKILGVSSWLYRSPPNMLTSEGERWRPHPETHLPTLCRTRTSTLNEEPKTRSSQNRNKSTMEATPTGGHHHRKQQLEQRQSSDTSPRRRYKSSDIETQMRQTTHQTPDLMDNTGIVSNNNFFSLFQCSTHSSAHIRSSSYASPTLNLTILTPLSPTPEIYIGNLNYLCGRCSSHPPTAQKCGADGRSEGATPPTSRRHPRTAPTPLLYNPHTMHTHTPIRICPKYPKVFYNPKLKTHTLPHDTTHSDTHSYNTHTKGCYTMPKISHAKPPTQRHQKHQESQHSTYRIPPPGDHPPAECTPTYQITKCRATEYSQQAPGKANPIHPATTPTFDHTTYTHCHRTLSLPYTKTHTRPPKRI